MVSLARLSPGLTRASRRYLWRHPWNLWLSVLGIGLGVAVVVAVEMANQSARTAFSLSMEAVTGKATHSIVGGPIGLPEQVYVDLRRQPGALKIAPLLEANVNLQGESITLLGIDPFAEGPFRDGLKRIGQGGLSQMLLQPASLMMPLAMARRLRLDIGDDFTLSIAGQPRQVVLAAVFDSDNPAAREGLLLADLAVAQELTQRFGVLDRIDLILDEAQAQRISAALPAGLRLQRAAARTAATVRMSEAFQVNLTAMSLLALLVGGFIIYNTMTFSVLRRRALFGHLRVLGVTRDELFRLIIVEALLLGLAGTLAGLLAGSAIASVLVQLVTRTINDLYFHLAISRLFISPPVLLKGALLGIGATLAAALLPALEAARSQPRDVQRRTQLETRLGGMLPWLALGGGGLMALAWLLIRLPSQSLLLAFAALFLLIVGFSLTVPVLLSLFMRWLQPLLERLAPPVGRLAARGIARSLSRTAPAVAALTVAISATVGVGVMIGSFRDTVNLWLQQTLTSDIYISAPSTAANRAGGTLDAEILPRLQQVAGIGDISRGRSVRLTSQHGEVEVLAIKMAAHSYRGFRLKGSPLERLWRRFDNGELILVSEPYAYRHGIAAGDRLSLFTPQGWREFSVGGIFFDYGTDQGKLLMQQQRYAELWQDPGYSALGISLQQSARLESVLADVRRALEGIGQAFQLRASGEIRQHSMEVFERTFAVTQVLRLLSIGVAFIGILSALLALHLERAKEHAILRASGATPRQMLGLVTLQSALLGLIAGLLALPLGMLMSDILIHAVNLRSFGWTLQTSLPAWVLAEAMLLALLAAVLAGLYPAWRVAHTAPADALREE